MRYLWLWCPSLALAQRASEFETSGGLSWLTPAAVAFGIIYLAILIRWPAEAFILAGVVAVLVMILL